MFLSWIHSESFSRGPPLASHTYTVSSIYSPGWQRDPGTIVMLVEHFVEAKIHLIFMQFFTSANDLGQLGKQRGHS